MTRDWLAQRAGISPSQTALIFGPEEWNYAQLNAWADGLARGLQEKGARKGDHVGVLLPNRPTYVAVIHALARLGAAAVPLNLRMKADMLGWQIARAGCALVLCSEETEGQIGDLGADEVEMIPVESMNWSTLPEQEIHSTLRSDRFDLDAVQGIFFTSGTTGRPKGAMITFGNHLWSAMGSAYRLGLDPADRWLLVLPLYHIGGQAIVFRACQYGIGIVLEDGFEPERLYESLQKHQVSLVSLVPTMLNRLMPFFDNGGLPDALRCILLGGAAASRDLVDECVEKNIPIALTYGLTEAASQVATASPAQVRSKPGSVGKPLFPSEVRILKQDFTECQANEIGEIVVSGPTVMKGYLDNGEATEEAFVGGALHTGDLGYMDEEGDLWVVNRRDDLIVTGGENVYPAEVEAILTSHPAVEEACVVGVNDAEWGHRVAAAVVVSDPTMVTEEDIIEYCRARIAGYKTPRTIHFIDRFPRTASGKILRGEVKELVEIKGICSRKNGVKI